MILNLTPHPIRLYANERNDGSDDLEPHLLETLEPSGKPARLAMIELGRCDGAELVEYGHAHDIPPQRDGVRLIVSLPVALALAPRRNDLLVPYREVRNSTGTVIGCRALAQPV